MVKISFDFDETTKKVSNMTVISLDTEQPTLTVESNKLQLSKAAVKLLQVKPDDRLDIQYWNVNNEETFPVIGKADVFTDAEGGKRLTKSNTLSYKGKQQETLLSYGRIFEICEFKSGMFKLVKLEQNSQEDLSEEENALTNLENVDIDENLV